MPFFWFINIIVNKFSVWRLPSVAVVEKTLWPQLKAVPLGLKCLLSYLDSMYLPGRSRKK